MSLDQPELDALKTAEPRTWRTRAAARTLGRGASACARPRLTVTWHGHPSRMNLTPHNQLQQWLILALGEMGGGASRAEALARIDAIFGSYFTTDDLDSPPSRPFETKWRNRVSWQRDRMVKAGLLLPFEGYGTPWRLSDAGRREYEELRQEITPGDPLVNFKPKDSSDYISHVEGRVLVKRRSHEALIAGLRRVVWRPRLRG